MNQPKQQHYLPESYLKRFTNQDGLLWIYDWEQAEFRTQSPHNTCKENNFNTIVNEDGSKDFGVEQTYSDIEGKAKSVIDHLANGNRIDGYQTSDLALFVAGMYSRIPAFREMYEKSTDKMRKEMMKMMIQTESDVIRYSKRHLVSPKEFLDIIQGERYMVTPHKNKTIQTALRIAAKAYEVFYGQNWIIFKCDKKQSFVTSDTPLALYTPPGFRAPSHFGGFGFSTPGVEKRFPLSNNLMLVMLDRGEETKYGRMTYDGVRHFNEYAASRSNRFLIGRDRPLLESLVAAVKGNHAHGYGFEVHTPFDAQGGLIALTAKRKNV